MGKTTTSRSSPRLDALVNFFLVFFFFPFFLFRKEVRMNLITSIFSILCLVSLVAGIPANGYKRQKGLMQAPPRLELESQPRCINPPGFWATFICKRVEGNNGVYVGCDHHRHGRGPRLGRCWRQRSFNTLEWCYFGNGCATNENCAATALQACPDGRNLVE